MPPKRGAAAGKATVAAKPRKASSSSSSSSLHNSRPASSASNGSRKRDHEEERSGISPVKKKETKDGSAPSTKHIHMSGFTDGEKNKVQLLIKEPFVIDETLSDAVTHVVIKSMGGVKTSLQLLPIYYAVLKGLWILKPSFLPSPSTGRRKSLTGGPPALEQEEKHAYDEKEVDLDFKPKFNFPTIHEIVSIKRLYEGKKKNGKAAIFDSDFFQKVIILAGRSKESKQRREYLTLSMEAGGAKVMDESFWKACKAKRRKGAIENPSMVIIVNGETNLSPLGLDDDFIRDLLKARIPLFYEEFVTNVIRFNLDTFTLDDLLLQSFVFIHESIKSVDPDGKLQELVLSGELDGDREKTPNETPTVPSMSRRPNSRVASNVRETSGVGKEKRKGKREKEEEEEEEEKDDEMEGGKGTPPKRAKASKEKAGPSKVKEEEDEDEISRESITSRVKGGKGKTKKTEEKVDQEETPKVPRKEIKTTRDRQRKEEEEEKKEKKKVTKTEEKKMKEEEEMEVDPSLVDSNSDLLADFEAEIAQKVGKNGRKKMTKEEMKELREMREDRGDNEVEKEEEPPITPEPILFSQVATQPPIEIPETLRKALEVKEEEEGEKEEEESTPSLGDLVIDETESNKGTVVDGEEEKESDDERKEMEMLREEMNNERNEKKKDEEEEERPESPEVAEMASELRSDGNFGLKSMAPITIEDTKECETCNHLGTAHLYINKQSGEEIAKHFSSSRLSWFDLIVDVKEKMPWIKEGKTLRPTSEADADPMEFQSIDLFNTFYHELDDDSATSSLLSDLNSSNAMEMYEAEWEENEWRRPPIDLLIKMLHEFAVKRHSEDLLVPFRACSALKNAVPVTLPSSIYGRKYWMTILAGGSQGIKGRPSQVLEEMSRRCNSFLYKALLTDLLPPSIAQFVVYLCEVDLLCAQTPVVEYEMEGEEELLESQRTKGGKTTKKKHLLDGFPLILLLVMEMGESTRRGLSESAIVEVQKMMERVGMMKRKGDWCCWSTSQRSLLCLLEAVKWHCGQAATSALTGASRRRIKAAESIGEIDKLSVELQQNVQRMIRWTNKKGLSMSEIREMLSLSWLEDVVDTVD